MASDSGPADAAGEGSAAAVAAQELELKVAISPDDAGKVRRSRPVRALKHGRARTRRLRSVYFDTPDQALRRAGLALRIRHIGRRRVQTVKSEAGHEQGLAARAEWECDVAGDLPDLAAIGDPVLARCLEQALDGQAPVPVFETDIRRTAWQLHPPGGGRVELALDIGSLVAGDRSEPLSEVELELKEGRVAAIFDIAAELHRDLPFRFEFRSKSERGYALAAGEPPVPVRARAPALHPAMTAQEAFIAVAAACLAQAEANEAAAADGRDPEGVHQLRVACRRLRSAFSLFRPVLPPSLLALAAEFKWFAGELGDARDWDVFLAETLEPLRLALPGEAALAALEQAAQESRAQGYARARAAIAAPRYTTAKLALRRGLAARDREAWAEGVTDGEAARLLHAPVTDLAGLLLHRRAKRFRRLGRRIEALGLPELHELRIRGKKLRYATEFFASLYPGRRSRAYGAALARLQDVLGVLNDSAVAHQLLQRVAAGREPPPWLERADAILAGWYAAQRSRRLRRLKSAWKTFARCRRFWPRPERA